MNTQVKSANAKMSQFTLQTLWTATPQKAVFDASQVKFSTDQLDQLASALRNVSPKTQGKLDAFRSISFSEAAAFIRIR